MKHRLIFSTVLAVTFVFATFVSLQSKSVRAASLIIVDTAADETTVNGQCSLREAIIAANRDIAVDSCTAGSGID
ncbi:MAG TPA: CSLREA domain-containing protein, partial [Anaerolineae bacterium]|nr:CSLREA domain-containing protein [Anaerolineae bacterium]